MTAALAEQDICAGSIAVIAGTRLAGKTVDMRKNGRQHHGLLYLRAGTVQFSSVSDHEITAGTGDIVLIPKGLHYTMRYTAPETAFVLVNFELFSPAEVPLSLADDIRILTHISESHRVADLFTRLEQGSNEENTAVLFRRKSDFFALLAELFDGTPSFPNPAARPKFTNIIPGVNLLQQHYTENLPIPQFAAACNISVSSFRALFTAQYGCSPIQYRNQLRIKRAKYLLSTGNYTVTETADAVGFSNLGHFCCCYKKLTGESPRQSVTHDA